MTLQVCGVEYPYTMARSIFVYWLGRQAAWLTVLLSLGLIVGGLAIYFFDAPQNLDLEAHPLAESSTIYDRSGTVALYEIYGEENRHIVRHEDIPESVRAATVAAEDTHFYTHPGIDVAAVVRAAFVNVRRQGIEQGGSTITQQLARSLFLSRERTWIRKIREIILAIKIESRLTKDEILDLYLNAVPYGSNAYGIEAAAKTFFRKSAADLTLDEAALLAALPNAPTALSPFGSGKGALIARKNAVLAKMRELQSITEAEYETALAAKTLDKIVPIERRIIAPHFVFFIRQALEEEFGRERLETGGLKVTTTLDLDFQKTAEDIVQRGVERNVSRGASNGALVAINPENGDILAMVGSRNYFDTKIDGQVNVAIEKRQPGSSFKPFAYATAFIKGYQPETRVYDVPINFGPDGAGQDYIPNDYDGKFRGPLTMRQALAQSLNIPAVTTLYLAGIPDTIALATRLGITTLTTPERYGLALVLGGAEVRLLDMVSAFGVFGQEGLRHPATGLRNIVDREGKSVMPRTSAQQEQVLDPEVARRINSILSDNTARTPIFGPNSPLAFKNEQVAAKTGTTQNFRDAWTIGYTPKIAIGVWTGNNDNTPMREGADGIFVAAPLWREAMDYALTRFPETGFTAYTPTENTRTPIGSLASEPKIIYIDKKTGKKLSAKEAKKKRSSRVEVFVSDGGVRLPAGKENGEIVYSPRTLDDLRHIYGL